MIPQYFAHPGFRYMNWKSSWTFLLVFGFLSSTTMLAWAEDDEAAEEAVRVAQEAFETGAQHYYEDNFGRAIVEFRKAHRAHPHPMFLHNIALSNKRLGRMDRARSAAAEAAAMTEELPPETAARNMGIIAGATGVLTGQQVAEDVARNQPEEDDTQAPPTPEPVAESGGFGPLGWAGVGALVVGVGALGGAAVIDSQISSELNGLNSGETQEQFDATIADLEGKQTTGQILLFSGIGLSTVGAGLLIFELVSGGSSSDQQLSFSPTFHQPGMEVQFRW